MLKILDTWFGFNKHRTKLTLHDGDHTIRYCNDTIQIEYNKDVVFTTVMHGDIIHKISIEGYTYTFNSDQSLVSITYNDRIIYCKPYLDGDINGNIYRNGEIIHAIVNGNMYKRSDCDTLPYYLVYTDNGIYGYLMGVNIVFVEDRSRYILVADGHVLGFTSILDTMTQVHWDPNLMDILVNIKGYNPYPFVNMLPEHYFFNFYWDMLKRNNINVGPSKDIVLKSKPIRHYITRSLFIAYEGSRVTTLYGYQPHISIVNGNLHGLLFLDDDYYYHHGILQWKRKGNHYIVRYSDHETVHLQIYRDRVIYNGMSYPFKDNIVRINDIGINILFNHGVPITNTYSKEINVPPNEW